jgi:hypothetical protein
MSYDKERDLLHGSTNMGKIHHLSECQNHRCCYCGHPMIDIEIHHLPTIPHNAMTKEHVEPKSYGGIANRENLVAACSLCNYLRGNMDYVAFSNLVQKWFRRDKTLKARWHQLTREERYFFKQICLVTQERQLRGLASKHALYAERHTIFIAHYGEQLQLRA